jgi:hypothetical protein
MSRHETPMIKKKKGYESLVYETLFDPLIGDALSTKSVATNNQVKQY